MAAKGAADGPVTRHRFICIERKWCVLPCVELSAMMLTDSAAMSTSFSVRDILDFGEGAEMLDHQQQSHQAAVNCNYYGAGNFWFDPMSEVDTSIGLDADKLHEPAASYANYTPLAQADAHNFDYYAPYASLTSAAETESKMQEDASAKSAAPLTSRHVQQLSHLCSQTSATFPHESEKSDRKESGRQLATKSTR